MTPLPVSMTVSGIANAIAHHTARRVNGRCLPPVVRAFRVSGSGSALIQGLPHRSRELVERERLPKERHAVLQGAMALDLAVGVSRPVTVSAECSPGGGCANSSQARPDPW